VAEVLDDAVAPRPAVHAVAGHDQLRHREVAHEADDQPDQVLVPARAHQRLDEGADVLRPARGVVQQLTEEVGVFRGEQAAQMGHRIPGGEGAHDGEEVRQDAHGEGLPPGRIGQLRLQALQHLPGIEDEGEQVLQLGLRHPRAEEALHERPQRPGGVVDDVAQLHVLAVDVADHVHRPLGQRELGAQARDLGQSGVGVREATGERPQRGQFHVVHGSSSIRIQKSRAWPAGTSSRRSVFTVLLGP
jgi:hypothetical protein